MDGTAFTATHVVSAEGTGFWSEPDPNRPVEGRLDPFLPVQLLTEAMGWAHVRCSNGWETWVDGRFLSVPGAAAPYATPGAAAPYATPGAAEPYATPGAGPGPGPTYSPQRAAPDGVAIGLPLAGAALAILGGVLPWISAPIDSLSAWDIPVKSLFDTQNVEQGLDTGPVLLVLLVTLVPLFSRRSLPRGVTGGLAALTIVIALLGFRLYSDLADLAPGINLGFGLVLTAVGGILLLVGTFRQS